MKKKPKPGVAVVFNWTDCQLLRQPKIRRLVWHHRTSTARYSPGLHDRREDRYLLMEFPKAN